MNRLVWTLLFVVTSGGLVQAEEPPAGPAPETPLVLPDRRETFGGVLAPAALPFASSSAYALLGVPELAGGYRQGFRGFEIEGRVRLDYVLLAGALEGVVKVALLHTARLDLAPFLGVGFVANSGLAYLDASNFAYVGARALGGISASYLVMETVRLVGVLEVPVDFSLSPSRGRKFTPLAGAGAEIYLGQDMTGLVLGQLGANLVQAPGGPVETRLGYAVRLGLGFRLF